MKSESARCLQTCSKKETRKWQKLVERTVPPEKQQRLEDSHVLVMTSFWRKLLYFMLDKMKTMKKAMLPGIFSHLELIRDIANWRDPQLSVGERTASIQHVSGVSRIH